MAPVVAAWAAKTRAVDQSAQAWSLHIAVLSPSVAAAGNGTFFMQVRALGTCVLVNKVGVSSHTARFKVPVCVCMCVHTCVSVWSMTLPLDARRSRNSQTDLKLSVKAV